MAVEKRRSRQVSSRPLNVDNELAVSRSTDRGIFFNCSVQLMTLNSFIGRVISIR